MQNFLGAYALDAVDEAQRSEVDHHLEQCDHCREELADLREAVYLLPNRLEPSEVLWKRSVSELRREPSQAELVPNRLTQWL